MTPQVRFWRASVASRLPARSVGNQLGSGKNSVEIPTHITRKKFFLEEVMGGPQLDPRAPLELALDLEQATGAGPV
jgi:hypothetical protein